MKTNKILKAVSLLLILIIAVSCRNSRSTTGKQYPRNVPAETPTRSAPVYVDGGNLPPGQAKKIYGSQSAKTYAPGQRKKYGNRHPLIIVYSPGIVISRYSDGRYYYRNTAGYTYWKGYDGRYYIDEKHLKGMDYDASDYDDWKFKGQKNNNAQEQKGNAQEEKVKDNQKTKDAGDIVKVREQKEKDEKVKDNDPKGKDHTEKAKDDNSQKGKAKSKDKG